MSYNSRYSCSINTETEPIPIENPAQRAKNVSANQLNMLVIHIFIYIWRLFFFCSDSDLEAGIATLNVQFLSRVQVCVSTNVSFLYAINNALK